MITAAKNYLSLIKFSHTIFAMPFALIGFFLGIKNLNISVLNGVTYLLPPTFFQKVIIFFQYKWIVFVLVILCMVFARSAAMAFNRYLDRKFDAKNPRTAIREIPSGIIHEKNALIFTIVNCLLFIATTFFINRICFYLSPVALVVILFYSYTKRFTALCHLVLGLGLSLAPVGAYLAVIGSFHLLPILFSFAVLFWVSGFDIIYALQDEAFDKENDLYSIPAWLGKAKGLRVSELLHVLSAITVMAAGFYGHFGIAYWIGIAVFIGMLIYQHSIVKPNDLRKVNIAFMTANGIASVVFAIFVITDMFI
ncbi:MAG: UbiA-like polyprenyltransferase [Ferruginibacter sp.]